MIPFFEQIKRYQPTPDEARARRWIYVPYDRLHDGVGPLRETKPEDAIVVLMESRAKGTRRPYHKKKLTFVLSAMRHFALEQAERGCRVVYGYSPTSFSDGLMELQERWGWAEIVVNRPAERELRVELREARQNGLRIRAVSDTAWLSTTEDFEAVFGKPQPVDQPGGDERNTQFVSGRRQYLMDRFYRAMRRKTGFLMQGAQPIGGQWSYDAENRKPYRGEVPIPERPNFAPDEITLEVMQLVERRFPDHFGTVEGFEMPVTRAEAERGWQFALENMLPHFGPWEDAMSVAHPDLFHSLTSAPVNLTLLRPVDLVTQTVAAYEAGKIPLQSTEGFVRQLLGWREFMRHIHEATDGYRTIHKDGAPSFLDAHRALPPVYWGVKSGMRCMDLVVAGVIEKGWSHHITRLMVLSNLATLCGFSPRELCDWFWFGYVDAYDWVVEPNVIGMSTFGDGGLTATKPYVSGAAYINRMSDFCGKCALDPRKSTGPGSCPYTSLYWNFLERNEAKLAGNQRMRMPLNTMLKKTAADRAALRERAEEAIGMLERGEVVR
ncbi:MAG: cryptochrome/photolyase family protein [Janthinobacterium lividum]